jgi:hypothetical protein
MPSGDFVFNLTTGRQYTFNFWYKKPVNTATYPLAKGVNTAGWDLIIRNDGSQNIFRNSSTTQFYLNITNPVINVWHMNTITINATQSCWYVNGTLANCNVSSFYSIPTVSNFTVGCQYDGITNGFQGYMDEIGWWNRTLNATEISLLYNDGAGISKSETISSTLNYPVNKILLTNVEYNLNATITGFGTTVSNVTLFINGFVNETRNISGTINQTLFPRTFVIPGSYNWSLYACDSTMSCRNSTLGLFNITSVLENSKTFNTSTYETSTESFILNTNISSQIISKTAILYYNGSSYTSTVNSINNITTFTNIIQVPLGIGNKSFYWTLNLDGTLINTTKQNQSVSLMNLSICGAAPQNIPFYNYSVYNEETLVRMNASFENIITYWFGDGSLTKQLVYSDLSGNYSNFPFCFSPPDRTLKLADITEYYAPGFDHRTYKFSNDSFTNTTTQIPLYLLSTASSDVVTLTVVDDFYTPLEGVIIKVYRWNVATDTYYLVNTITTGSSGTAGTNLVLNDIYYLFYVYYNVKLYLTTSPEKIIALTKTLQIFISSTPNSYEDFNYASGHITFDNSTNLFTFVYSDTANKISGACLNVQKIEIFGSTTLVQNCSNLTSNTLTFNIGTYGNSTFFATGVASANSTGTTVYKLLDSKTITIRSGPDRFSIIGRAGQAISLVFIGTLAMIGIASGSIPFGLLLIVVGFIALNLVGLANFTYSFIVSMISIIVLVAISLQRRFN